MMIKSNLNLINLSLIKISFIRLTYEMKKLFSRSWKTWLIINLFFSDVPPLWNIFRNAFLADGP